MAAITKRLLHLRPNFHSYTRPHPYPFHHFSSSSDPDTPQPDPNSETQARPSLSSKLDDVRASLQQRQPPPQNRHQATPPPARAESTEEIRRHLSDFRIRSAAPPPPSSSSSGQYVSFQELYEKNFSSKGDGSANPSGLNSGGKASLDSIRASLRRLSPTSANDSGGKASDRWSLSRFTEDLKLKGDQNASQHSRVFGGGSESFIPSFLRKDTTGKGDGDLGSMGLRWMQFGKRYDHLDLGKKLKTLRPEKRKGKWFSLQELSDRLVKLREAEEAEEKENAKKFGGQSLVRDLKDGLIKVKQSKEKAQKGPMQSLGFLGSIGGTESYELSPPKKHLVEKYFHPDNMSSAEKLKLELKKVRDEFKMSESDCGSARVQVAQLTIKIKHLSTVLQKKDKHSRRGLVAMVKRREKLMKYLRRTDFDSYCLVSSKLDIREKSAIKTY